MNNIILASTGFNWWNVTTSAYTNVMGYWFYMIVIAVITMAIYLKTNDLTVAGLFMLIASVLLSPVVVMVPEGKLVFMIAIALGITVAIAGFYINTNRRAI